MELPLEHKGGQKWDWQQQYCAVIEHVRDLCALRGRRSVQGNGTRLQQTETLVSVTVNRFIHFTICEGSGGKYTSTPYAASYKVMTRFTLRPL